MHNALPDTSIDSSADITGDRRTHPRLNIQRPCKFYNPRTGRYFAGATCNFSAGGMLVRLDSPHHVQPGETLLVGMAQKRRQMLLRSSEMIKVRIARRLQAADGEVLLGLELLDPSLANEPHLRCAA